MTFLAPAIPSLITAGLKVGGGLIADKLLGGKSGKNQPPGISGFSGGGLSGGFSGGNYNVSSSQNRTGMIQNTANLFNSQANALGALRDQVTPGYGRLTNSLLSEIDNRKTAAIGNLRDNLARRKVMGSSFASDALTRSELEFAKEAEKVKAQSFLQEMEMANNLINQEFEARRNEFNTFLGELNLQADIASKLSQSATQVLASNAELKTKLAAQSAAGAGQFFGQALSPALDKVGGLVGDKIGSMISG